MIELVLTICALAAPDRCDETRIQFVSQESLMQCMMQAPPYIAEWSSQHHALHHRFLRSELKPLFIALGRRAERAHRQNQLDHCPPASSGLAFPFTSRMWHFEWATATLRLDARRRTNAAMRRQMLCRRRAIRRVRRLAKHAKLRNAAGDSSRPRTRMKRGKEARS